VLDFMLDTSLFCNGFANLPGSANLILHWGIFSFTYFFRAPLLRSYRKLIWNCFLLIRTGKWTICPYTERYLLPYGIISSLPLALSCNQILSYNRHHFNETSVCVGHVTECFTGYFRYQK